MSSSEKLIENFSFYRCCNHVCLYFGNEMAMVFHIQNLKSNILVGAVLVLKYKLAVF